MAWDGWYPGMPELGSSLVSVFRGLREEAAKMERIFAEIAMRTPFTTHEIQAAYSLLHTAMREVECTPEDMRIVSDRACARGVGLRGPITVLAHSSDPRLVLTLWGKM